MEILEVVNEIEKHLLEDKKPSIYLNEAKNKGFFKIQGIEVLNELENIPQSPKHHPEGNVWNHTLLVVDEAAKYKDLSSDARVFMWAALIHDIGKEKTTMNKEGRITAYDHDRVGAEMARRMLRKISEDIVFNEKVVNLVRYHMQYLYVSKRLPFSDIKAMSENSNPEDIALLSLCDRFGRGKLSKSQKEDMLSDINKFLKQVSSTSGEEYKLIEDLK
ncbi:HDIG domain-containing protein [Clostridium cavendishii DSM 21758]|uniref:HDIG domain-containing protein n=1 Tax=Clostridium cavendishii DSM 21758 TaxID=1121302 RepID=A0A1M6CHR9_9CLOT|nr:HDIG domain-containing metalloprotein [Clostridium cavendishii]SHI60570.1 HDIG domain-containing protein [Clostridium cavendishii DSM 21758]